MSSKSRFRPTVQMLETRQLMAADLGFEEVDATPEEPARENTTVITTTISGNTANSEGGGLWNDAGGTMTIEGTTITGNTASNGGGGLAEEISQKVTPEGDVAQKVTPEGQVAQKVNVAPYPGFTGGVRVAVGDVNGDAGGANFSFGDGSVRVVHHSNTEVDEVFAELGGSDAESSPTLMLKCASGQHVA